MNYEFNLFTESFNGAEVNQTPFLCSAKKQKIRLAFIIYFYIFSSIAEIVPRNVKMLSQVRLLLFMTFLDIFYLNEPVESVMM